MSLARMVAISAKSPCRVFAQADSSDAKVRVALAAIGGSPAKRSKREGVHGREISVERWCQATDSPRSRLRSRASAPWIAGAQVLARAGGCRFRFGVRARRAG